MTLDEKLAAVKKQLDEKRSAFVPSMIKLTKRSKILKKNVTYTRLR